MRAGIFIPFGSTSPEAGVIALVGNYLRGLFPDSYQLLCNGLFSFCDRDAEVEWSRDSHTCARCLADQKQSCSWASLTPLELSTYLSKDDVWESRRWALGLSDSDLLSVEFKGLRLYDLFRGSFRTRFGTENVDLANRNHAHFARKLVLATVRTCMATRRFNNVYRSDLTLVAGGYDFITSAFVEQSKRQERPAAVFRWEASNCAVRVSHPFSADSYMCNFVLENVSSMRSDVRSWPPEITQVVQELLAFLNVSETQLALPLAR